MSLFASDRFMARLASACEHRFRGRRGEREMAVLAKHLIDEWRYAKVDLNNRTLIGLTFHPDQVHMVEVIPCEEGTILAMPSELKEVTC